MALSVPLEDFVVMSRALPICLSRLVRERKTYTRLRISLAGQIAGAAPGLQEFEIVDGEHIPSFDKMHFYPTVKFASPQTSSSV